MLVYEAKEEIESRLTEALKHDYAKDMPEYFQALEIAVKALDAQIRLIDTLNDWDIETEIKRGDTYSASACHDIVRQFSIYCKDEDEEENVNEDTSTT